MTVTITYMLVEEAISKKCNIIKGLRRKVTVPARLCIIILNVALVLHSQKNT